MQHLKLLSILLFFLNVLAAPTFDVDAGLTVPDFLLESSIPTTTSSSTRLPQASPVRHDVISANTTEHIRFPDVNVNLWWNLTVVYIIQVPFDNQFHMLKDLICVKAGALGIAQYTVYGCDHAQWEVISYLGGPPCRFTDSIGLNATLTDDMRTQPVPTLGIRQLVSGCCGWPCLN